MKTSASVYTSPIIFMAPMIRALLDGRKTQTRRLITSQWSNVKMHYEMGDSVVLWVRQSLRPFSTAHLETGEHGLAAYYAAGGGDGQTFVWNAKSDTTGIPSIDVVDETFANFMFHATHLRCGNVYKPGGGSHRDRAPACLTRRSSVSALVGTASAFASLAPPSPPRAH